METKHSKGPFKGVYKMGNSGDDDIIHIQDAYDMEVCQIIVPWSEDEADIQLVCNDAALLSAAPDLLQAVQHVLEASEDGSCIEDSDIDWNMLRVAVEKATTPFDFINNAS